MSGTTRVTPQDFEVEALTADALSGLETQVGGALAHPDFIPKVDPWARYRDKVAIVGFTGHRKQALELDDSFEIWGLNELYRYMPADRFHRWFEIHGRDYLCQDDEGKKHIEDLKTQLGTVPIYMQRHHADIFGSTHFPIELMKRYFQDTLDGPPYLGEYFTNCPAMMVAFAVMLGYKEIHVYGVDMAQASEYVTQRPNCEWWLGVAAGRGIKIHVPDLSDLLKCVGVYGYKDEGNLFAEKLAERLEWLHAQDNDRLAKIRQLEAEYQAKKPQIRDDLLRKQGALSEERTLRKSERRDTRITELEAEIGSLEETLARLEKEYESKHRALMADRNRIVGGIEDVEYLMQSWLPKPSNKAGGNIPTAEQRAADPQTGITAPSGDERQPVTVGA